MKIITLTLNPAFDIHCYAKNFKEYTENFVEVLSKDAGGKGINISRALTYNGIDNAAYMVVGCENKKEFIKSIKEDNINYKEIEVSGKIRENITIHSDNVPETRISFSGFCINESHILKLRTMLGKENLKETIFTFTGSVPKGVNKECIRDFLNFIKQSGAKLVIDSKSLSYDDILYIKPWMIKPNEEEIRMYSNKSSVYEAADDLRKSGIENVIISLGEKGAIYSSNMGICSAVVPEIKVKSTIGAGDSLIAGFIGAISKGKNYIDAFKVGVSYGSAACLTNGTNPPKSEDIEEIYKNIKIEEIN